jgi:predicted nucleic acid-binding protein
MAERWSLDTNILVYYVDSDAGARHEMSRTIMARALEADCRLTLQALGEFLSVVLRRRVMPQQDAVRLVGNWIDLFDPAPASKSALRVALAAGPGFSSWDALLLATAAEAGCTTVVSEDMQDGARLGAVRVLHPFRGDTLSPAMRALLG